MWQLITLVQIALLSSANSIAPKYWKIPTPESMQNTLSYCSEIETQEKGTLEAQLVHCAATELGLWTDEEGFNAKRIAKMFSRYKQTEELLVVIEYCNRQTKPVDITTTTTTETTFTKWAYDAYKCATVGRIGKWLQDYLQMPLPQKVVNHKNIQEIYS